MYITDINMLPHTVTSPVDTKNLEIQNVLIAENWETQTMIAKSKFRRVSKSVDSHFNI